MIKTDDHTSHAKLFGDHLFVAVLAEFEWAKVISVIRDLFTSAEDSVIARYWMMCVKIEVLLSRFFYSI